ncbi:MAG: dTDP-4-dehydrorhamnose reductase [Chitinophagaceae bacterium]|nr:dTDP-4-dehydrorhamnose reductase [Chitinophagaceae bacterium]
MGRKKILVTGANGQLGNELRELSAVYPEYKFYFAGRNVLDISEKNLVLNFFEEHKFDYCINCAAYTAVDKAESERELSFLANATGPAILAEVSGITGTKLIHISTDYVYNGTDHHPLKEDSATGPVNVYGQSKLEGERLVRTENEKSLVIRTSWVYSSYGKNFVKTMMRLLSEREELNVVADQQGCPTYAADLADVIMAFIDADVGGSKLSGIYNYANNGVTTWYDFAVLIGEMIGARCRINPVKSEAYPTPAVRPLYSVLDTSKIRAALDIEIPFWKDSVVRCVERLRGGGLAG